MIADPETRLLRPRQLYIGAAERDLVPIAERATHAPARRLKSAPSVAPWGAGGLAFV
jgi:hypothetical protein